MSSSETTSLGKTWMELVQATLNSGASPDDQCHELLGVRVSFHAATEGDTIIRQFGDKQMIADMDDVFFSQHGGALDHSYAKLMRGPAGRQDLEDVVSLLRNDPASTRAVVAFCANGNGKVPCVNVVQFLVRNGRVQMMYFARGQDVFKKFYADSLCLAKMARVVATRLELPVGVVEGLIASSHVYHVDRAAAEHFVAEAKKFLSPQEPKGAY